MIYQQLLTQTYGSVDIKSTSATNILLSNLYSIIDQRITLITCSHPLFSSFLASLPISSRILCNITTLITVCCSQAFSVCLPGHCQWLMNPHDAVQRKLLVLFFYFHACFFVYMCIALTWQFKQQTASQGKPIRGIRYFTC